MARRASGAAGQPRDLVRMRQRLDEWRGSHARGVAFSAAVWSAAGRVARRHGGYVTAQEQAFAYGVKVSGCTVHFVDEELDHGAIIVQKTVPVLDGDDEHTLATRILEQEHLAYTEAIKIVLGGSFEVAGRRFVAS